jgi:hypothetical protein
MTPLYEWTFRKAVDGKWQWVRQSSDPKCEGQTSARTFRTLLEAINDAVLHGYLPPAPAARRTPTPEKLSRRPESSWDALRVN